jgi:hypothetical protein
MLKDTGMEKNINSLTINGYTLQESSTLESGLNRIKSVPTELEQSKEPVTYEGGKQKN